MRVLYTGGTFDVFHYGHANFLKQCKLLADNVVVSLNTDDFILDYKKKLPILSYKERELSLLGCKYVDSVVPNIGGKDSKPSILKVKPNIIAVGDDWAAKNYFDQMMFDQEWLDNNKIVLVYVPYTKGISTTDIKNRIMETK
jgi:glycerol-3-phosphate cytidylyltransferase